MGNVYSTRSATTYCRADCPGPRRPGEVRQFQLAAAAEAAGLTACPRCRPYRWPESVPSGIPGLVSRALQAVLDGFLDRRTEVELGRRLGISSRHLGRLFRAHLGLTPDQLARSQRAHFARRLLDDTDLSVADVATAAGFGSVRQCNRACLDFFHLTPSELRARRHRGDQLAADPGLSLRLCYDGGMDWESMLLHLRSRGVPGVEWVAGDLYRRTALVNGDPGVLEFQQVAPDTIQVRAYLSQWNGLASVVQRARHVFNLSCDPSAAESHLMADARLAPLVRTHPGLRPPGAWDPFEVGVGAILSYGTSNPERRNLMGRLTISHGTAVPGASAMGLTHTFPGPEALAGADLEADGLTPQQAATVSRFAGSVATHQLHLDAVNPLDAFEKQFDAVPGIQAGVPQYLALRLGYGDAFPCQDPGLRRAWLRLSSQSNTPGASVPGNYWHPYGAFAAMHLWTTFSGKS